jgi:hypothetical protein
MSVRTASLRIILVVAAQLPSFDYARAEHQICIDDAVIALSDVQQKLQDVEVVYRLEKSGIKNGFPLSDSIKVAFAVSNGMYAENTDVIRGPPTRGDIFPPERPSRFFDGLFFYKQWRSHRILEKYRADPSIPIDFDQDFFGPLGWWVVPAPFQAKDPDGYYLPVALTNYQYDIVSESSAVNDRRCIEARRSDGSNGTDCKDTLWYQLDGGFRLYRRIWSLGDNATVQDSRLQIDLSDYRECSHGAFLPWRIDVQMCRRRADKNGFSAIATSSLVVERIVSSSDEFASSTLPDIRPGTLIKLLETDRSEVIPGGVDLLDASVHSLTKAYVSSHNAAPPGGCMTVFACGGAAAACVVTAIYILRRRRFSRS